MLFPFAGLRSDGNTGNVHSVCTCLVVRGKTETNGVGGGRERKKKKKTNADRYARMRA